MKAERELLGRVERYKGQRDGEGEGSERAKQKQVCLRMHNSTLIGIGLKGVCSVKVRKATMMGNVHTCKWLGPTVVCF